LVTPILSAARLVPDLIRASLVLMGLTFLLLLPTTLAAGIDFADGATATDGAATIVTAFGVVVCVADFFGAFVALIAAVGVTNRAFCLAKTAGLADSLAIVLTIGLTVDGNAAFG